MLNRIARAEKEPQRYTFHRAAAEKLAKGEPIEKPAEIKERAEPKKFGLDPEELKSLLPESIRRGLEEEAAREPKVEGLG